MVSTESETSCATRFFSLVITHLRMELDATFQRALQLLISRKPDSGEKLKEMLFESLGREYVPPTQPKQETKLKTQVSHSQDSVESLDDEDDELGAETDYSTDVGGTKNDDTMDADDFAFDMGVSCVICRRFECSSNNQLLECHECHNLYHQLCHKPSVSEEKIDDDPRSIWCCHKCSSASKATSEKSEKANGSGKKSSESSSKEKKVKTEKKVKEKISDKVKDSEKEKGKKSKSGDKEVKSEGHKEKEGSKANDTVKSSKSGSSSKTSSSSKSASSGKTSSSSKSGASKSASGSKGDGKQKSSVDLKHKDTDSSHDKDKKAKKAKREK